MSAPARAPLRSLARWSGFVHLLARFYMDYGRAVRRAARRKGHKRAADVDTQPSKAGTPWALHWGTLGKNKLHDPTRRYGPRTRIDQLTDHELDRMRGPRGQHPKRLVTILKLASQHGVRVEVEAKAVVSAVGARRVLAHPAVASLRRRGLLQVKTLAWMGGPLGAVHRLAPWHAAGVPTILSFTGFGRRRGISKSAAWPVTDYVRGRPKWIA